MRLSNASKELVYKYINIKKQRFVKLLLFLHFIATGKFELLGILGTFKMAEHSYPNSPLNTLFAFVVLTLFKLPDPGASIYVQSLLKFPTWGAQERSKSPPHPVVPPLGHNIDSCISINPCEFNSTSFIYLLVFVIKE